MKIAKSFRVYVCALEFNELILAIQGLLQLLIGDGNVPFEISEEGFLEINPVVLSKLARKGANK